MRTPLVVAALLLAVAGSGGTARAQTHQIAEEPTGGVNLPATPLAGDQDARATSVNPAGLQFVGGLGLVLAIDAEHRDLATSAGPGVGVFVASSIGGGSWSRAPTMGLGLGVEWVRPSRTRFTPDPGTPLRTTLAWSLGLGPRAGIGVGWHHFYDDNGPSAHLGGTDTWDLGLSWRLGNHVALGGVIRDIGGPRVGGAEVRPRYELETTVRPTGTDRLDLGLGGRLGGKLTDEVEADGWLRASVRATRGVYVHALLESRELQIVETQPSGAVREYQDRDLRATLGLEISFGGAGITTYGSGVYDEDGDVHVLGGTLVARLSSEEGPAVQGRSDRIERIEISGDVGPRAMAHLVLRLRAIARDPAARAVVFTIDGIDAGWATVQELREEIVALRTAGKKTFAYLVDASTRDYFLASACDKIYVDPAGGVRLTGFAANTMYFRGTFDKLGIDAEFEKIAEYKSAPESYTDIGPSAPALAMHDAIFDSLFEELVGAIVRGRDLDRETVLQLIDGGPYSAGDLDKDKRIVDAVADPDQVAQLVSVELGRLYPVGPAPDERDDRWERSEVAVIYADGDIVDGASRAVPLLGSKLVGASTLVDALEKVRRDPRIKAVVLRIDSPGGSALASELMSREVFKTRGVKPIICSMGDVAASGGYYLAAGCDWIFADPMTITGSIGIFSGKFDVSGLLGKLGVSVHTSTRGKHADMDSLYRPYTDEERTLMHDKLTYFYGRFTGAVAKGRAMTDKQVDDVGRGHVWTGKQAQGIRLVDAMGGLGDAIDYAKAKAGLAPGERVRIVELPKVSGGLLSLLLGNVARARAAAGPADALELLMLPEIRAALEALPPSLLAEPDQVQARLPFNLVW
jgi:protease-4